VNGFSGQWKHPKRNQNVC